ncbi:DUF6036 family nucleotidyltransferase [Cohnella sp.]|uniref:DUF6036 family nucleotidyltransferase n=1 Tax=Cohnella sp. TaxID=1883426 RepID=UPI003562B9E7
MDRLDLFDGNDPFATQESILQLFEEVDKDLKGQPLIDVYVVGYSAIVLARKNNRGSNDVDIIPSRFSRVFSDHGLEVFDEHYFYLPTDYKSRAREVDKKYESLRVKYVDAHDIWFTKLGAFRNKDKVDMIQMIKESVVDANVLIDIMIPKTVLPEEVYEAAFKQYVLGLVEKWLGSGIDVSQTSTVLKKIEDVSTENYRASYLKYLLPLVDTSFLEVSSR